MSPRATGDLFPGQAIHRLGHLLPRPLAPGAMGQPPACPPHCGAAHGVVRGSPGPLSCSYCQPSLQRSPCEPQGPPGVVPVHPSVPSAYMSPVPFPPGCPTPAPPCPCHPCRGLHSPPINPWLAAPTRVQPLGGAGRFWGATRRAGVREQREEGSGCCPWDRGHRGGSCQQEERCARSAARGRGQEGQELCPRGVTSSVGYE